MANKQDLHLSWDDLHKDAKALAARLKGPSWTGIIAIARGGLIPASIIAQELNIRHIETISISSYDFQTQGSTKILSTPQGVTYGGKNWLVIDDLTDSGNTFAAVRKILPGAHYACLYEKPAGIETTDVFVREITQDTWVHFPWETGKD